MINKLFTTMKTEVGDNVQDTSSASATIIGRYINEAYFEFLNRVNYSHVKPDYSFTTTASTRDYVLPEDFGKPLNAYDDSNNLSLKRIDYQRMLIDNVSSWDSNGTVEAYDILTLPVQNQPSSSSVITFTSSSSSDTTQTVHIKGMSSGVIIHEDITLNGTSDVSTTNSFTEILSITKSAATTGKITGTSNSAAVTVAIMSPSALDYKVKVVRLFQTPANTLTIKMPYFVVPYPLEDDYDSPVVDCANYLIQRATAKILRRKRQYDKAKDFDIEAEKVFQGIIWNKENQEDQIHELRPTPYSRETV